MNRLSVRACASALALAVVALPGAAFAGTVKHVDPAKDAQKVVAHGSGTTISDAPAQKSADIVHFTAGYTNHRLAESTRLRALATQWVYNSRIKTPTSHFDLTVIHQAGTTQASLTKGAGQTLVTCDGLSRAVDRAKHVVAVKVPAACLGSPTWVQVGAGMVVLPKAGGTTYADDALRKAGVREKNLTLSKRLER